jgi:hypothetical protein
LTAYFLFPWNITVFLVYSSQASKDFTVYAKVQMKIIKVPHAPEISLYFVENERTRWAVWNRLREIG